MTLHEYPDVEQRSDEWHELRRGIVTASTIAQLITPATTRAASNDKSRALIAHLAAERITGRSDSVYVNDDMMRGILHEPIARDLYAEVNGVQVKEVGFMIREFSGGVKIGASPDGLIGADGGLEIKCPRAKTHIQTVLADEVPSYNMAQVQTSLVVSGRDWWDFVSFSSGLPLYTKRVYLDPKWHDAIITAATNAELAIGAMVRQFEETAASLPATEYIPDDVEVIV